jgi:hypothetical protein
MQTDTKQPAGDSKTPIWGMSQPGYLVTGCKFLTEPKPTYSAVTAAMVPASTPSKCAGVCMDASIGRIMPTPCTSSRVPVSH